MSFGSQANCSAMPREWKEAFVEAFSKFPDITFIMKFEVPEFPEGKDLKNLVVASWLPQNDILGMVLLNSKGSTNGIHPS